jgi:hypothetical protein
MKETKEGKAEGREEWNEGGWLHTALRYWLDVLTWRKEGRKVGRREGY